MNYGKVIIKINDELIERDLTPEEIAARDSERATSAAEYAVYEQRLADRAKDRAEVIGQKKEAALNAIQAALDSLDADLAALPAANNTQTKHILANTMQTLQQTLRLQRHLIRALAASLD